jgi:LysM repeat protein
MNALKTVVMVAFLGALSYVVYLSITKNPRQAGDQTASPLWPAAPKSQLTAPGALVPQLPATPRDAPVAWGPQASMPAPAAIVASPAAGAMPNMADPVVRPLPPPPPISADPRAMAPAGSMPLEPFPSTSSPAAAGPYASPAGYQNEQAASPWNSAPPAAEAPVAAAPVQPPQFDAEMQAQFDAIMRAVRTRLDQGQFEEGLQQLSRLYEMTSLPPEQLRQVADLVGQAAGTAIYSRQHVLQPPHVVQPDETLDRIAARYQITPELLARINGLDPRTALYTGQELKVLHGPFSAVVSLERRELVLYVKNLYAGRFPIGIGQDRPQLEGEYGVQNKVVAPVYRGPDQTTAAGADPRNPLGRYALDLGSGVAIHGTSDPAAIGRTDNRGTICLGDRDLDDVFGILTIGSKVTIQR